MRISVKLLSQICKFVVKGVWIKRTNKLFAVELEEYPVLELKIFGLGEVQMLLTDFM